MTFPSEPAQRGAIAAGPDRSLDQCRVWAEILSRDYRIGGRLAPLPGYHDRNFRVRTDGGGDLILKVMHQGCDPDLVDMQCAALDHIAVRAPDLPVAGIVRRLDGRLHGTCQDDSGAVSLVWLQTAMPGTVYADFKPQSAALRRSLGARAAELDRALADFGHLALTRHIKWDLQLADWIAERFDAIEDPDRRAIVARIVEIFSEVREALAAETSVPIHNDLNDHNILVAGSAAGPATVSGLIDFGDMIAAPIVCELAIAGAYTVFGQDRPARALADLVAGYHGVSPLTAAQLDLIWPLLLTRLAVSVVTSALRGPKRHGDVYAVISEAPAWRILETQLDRDPRMVAARLRAACGFTATPSGAGAATFLAAGRGGFAPVMGRDLGGLGPRDLAVASSTVPRNPLQLEDEEALALGCEGPGETECLGRYGEPRLIYTDPVFRRDDSPIADRRTVHLALDIFAPDGGSIHAPLDGRIHRAEQRAGRLNHDGMVILSHRTPDEDIFFTLYGHLDPASIAELNEGQAVERGEAFAKLGAPDCNGGWAPHLHFQLFLIDAGETGWPGVAEPDEFDLWRSVCPNPAAILNLDDEAVAYRPIDQGRVHAARREHFPGNLRLTYNQPAMFLRGWRHYLFDDWGRPFLDAYNNVPHVGHAHPRIRAVAADQLSRLNANTRYLHPAQVEFAQTPVAKMTGHLEICFFVNSGSEGNELALRLARAHTGGRDMVVPDHGYYGNTTGAIDVSAYKFGRPGGGGRPDWVHIVPVADTYRGRHRGPDAAGDYAGHVDRAIADIEQGGGALAGFIAETFPSVAGQIIPPRGYVRSVYAKIRAAGGVCIADEVQTGLGRLGRHYWGFEAQDAAPDIVVLGKPLGNGHPVGAVVTTREIARSFDNGIEFFSTFGGSTLSCRMATEVIRIVDEEGLQDNAARIGDHLLDGLRSLQDRHRIIGDVRGMGLFIGVDLVTDRDECSPAGAAAGYVKNRLREHRILVGTEGPDDNVLKIRPPLTFGSPDADLLLARLDETLAETEFF